MAQSSNRKEALMPLPNKGTVRVEKPKYTRDKNGCKNCKEKKKKCLKGMPCPRCRESGLECVYPPRPIPGPRKPQTAQQGGLSLDTAGPSTYAVHDVTDDLEDLSLPDDASYDSSSASVTPSLAPVPVRSPNDLPYFRNKVAPLLVIPGTDNPLLDLVMPLAETNETVLDAVYLVSVAHQAQLDPATSLSKSQGLYKLAQRVLLGLSSIAMNTDPRNLELYLATNVLLSYFEMIQSMGNGADAVRVYLKCSFDTLGIASGVSTTTTMQLEKILYLFDILLSLSTGQGPVNEDPRRLNLLHPPVSITSFTAIDSTFGMSLQFWPVLHRLAVAVSVRKDISSGSSAADDRAAPRRSYTATLEDVEAAKSEIISALRSLPRPAPMGTSSPIEAQRLERLIDHAEAFRAAGMIHLFRELYDMPPTASEVQSAAKTAMEACKRIVAENGPSVGLVWPLFVAATNLIEDVDIAAAREVLTQFSLHRCTNNVAVALKICEQVWMRRGRGMREAHWHQASADLLNAIVFG